MEKKKNYQKPDMKVFMLKHQPLLLVSDPTKDIGGQDGGETNP